ncbi:MAG TPA: hypothetical protein VKM36_12600 [Balneolaceae bacterium]|nr:hypothetical protein [Balneolaceae bacterium]
MEHLRESIVIIYRQRLITIQNHGTKRIYNTLERHLGDDPPVLVLALIHVYVIRQD